MRRRKLAGDLVAGVAAPNDQHRALRHVAGRAIALAVSLEHLGSELAGKVGNARRLEGAGGDNNLASFDGSPVYVEQERSRRPSLLNAPCYRALPAA